MGFRGIAYAVGRVAANPSRLRRLHYSKVLAVAHQAIEVDEFSLLERAFGAEEEHCKRLERDLLGDHDFRSVLEERYLEVRRQPIEIFASSGAGDANPAGRLLYYCVRLRRPEKVIDTGVLDGFSTAFILKGLHDNNKGQLWSIDLPAYDEIEGSSDQMSFGKLPRGHEPGWIIPDGLRSRWTLQKGCSRELLQPLLGDLGQLDLFYHDSLHTFEHMLWEYKTVWPYLGDDGVLLSDDIFWNRAFWKFTRETGSCRFIKRGVGLMIKAPSGQAQ